MLFERWPEIEQILESAIACDPARRAAFLDSACGKDPELRREVESLLAFQEDESFAAELGFADALRVLERRDQRLSQGRKIGAYRILREMGRGGMGNVYLAARADDAFQKLVAVKIIRRGMDLDDVVQRFRAERQILAMLDHPNIARLLDGGATEDGLPYFVMEYIEGEPIDVYCERRKLSTPERLNLFQSVCSAISYAHQNLVIHRDIKPVNILVTEAGVPRLLDFGIAKLLAPGMATDLTQAGVRPLTPEYASPEQVRGDPLTTASDIYSLGVLLYRLLTGRRPYRSPMSSAAEIERAICEEEPAKPDLPRDLSAIVLMALRKDPPRRYTSVDQFSEDVRRYFENLPVAARPDTRAYRAAKFIRRNKAWVTMAAITFISLAGGIAASLWQTHIARIEQTKATRMNAFLQEMIGGTWRTTNQKGLDATVADMLADAAQRSETELSDQPEVRAAMLVTIGDAYEQAAKYDLAEQYLGKAYDLNIQLHGTDSYQAALVTHALASLAYLKGDYVSADSRFQKVLQVYRRHTNDADFELRQMPAILSDAAFAARAVGRLDDAERLWREALTYTPRLPAKYQPMGATVKSFLAQLYIDRGDVDKADPLASEAVMDLRALGDRPSLAQSLIDLGNVRRLQGRYDEADRSIQQGTDLYAQSQGADHPNVAYGLVSLASSRYYQGRYDLAEEEARKALEIVEKLPKSAHSHELVNITLGLILNKTGRTGDAEPLLRETLEVARQNSRRPLDVALASAALGECLAIQKRYAEAEPLLIESYEISKSVQVPGSPVIRERYERLASFYTAWGKPSSLK
jgi:tetratricopeptide (TPR) repeat protein